MFEFFASLSLIGLFSASWFLYGFPLYLTTWAELIHAISLIWMYATKNYGFLPFNLALASVIFVLFQIVPNNKQGTEIILYELQHLFPLGIFSYMLGRDGMDPLGPNEAYPVSYNIAVRIIKFICNMIICIYVLFYYSRVANIKELYNIEMNIFVYSLIASILILNIFPYKFKYNESRYNEPRYEYAIV